jgi:hypothetical protein
MDLAARAGKGSLGKKPCSERAMDWTPIDTTDDLRRLDQAVCWEDSETLEYYASFRNEDFFPCDVNRSGSMNKNIHVLCRVDSQWGPYLELVLIDCDWYRSGFLDKPCLSGRVDSLKRVHIEDAWGATAMRCSRLIYRVLPAGDVAEGRYYRPGALAGRPASIEPKS